MLNLYKTDNTHGTCVKKLRTENKLHSTHSFDDKNGLVIGYTVSCV